MVMITTIKTLYNPEKVNIGIVHIGLGAFHRGHQAVYVEKNMNRHKGGNWSISAANVRSNAELVNQLTAQRCQYHVAEYSDSENATLREVNAIGEAIFAGDDKSALFARLLSTDTKIVTLTVTEKGYCLTPADKTLNKNDPNIQHDISFPDQPKTAPGILVEALFRRRALGLAPFTILSCDNMPSNGALIRQAVCELAAYRGTEFESWVSHHVAFPSSMVDRIVPAMTEHSLARLQQELHCTDPNAVMCEAFSQWVVEDNFPQGRPDWEHDGVQMVKDVHPFETMKLRLLNGSHSLLAYLGLAANIQTVAEAVALPEFVTLIRRYMTSEAMPTLNMPQGVNVVEYIETLIQRFSNDSLQHQLSQIATDGSQKIPQRWLSIVEENIVEENTAEEKTVTPVVALGVAAWILYMRGKDASNNEHPVNDPLAEEFNALHSKYDKPEEFIRHSLASKSVFPAALNNNDGFYQAVLSAYQSLLSKGAMATINAMSFQ